MASPPRSISLTRSSARLVGRRPPLRWLLRCLEEASVGKPGLVVVSGEAGIGKSRLAEALAAQAAERGFFVCRVRCDERRREPYGPLLDSLFLRLREVELAAPASPRIDEALRALLGHPIVGARAVEEILEDPESGDRSGVRLLLDLIDLTIVLARRDRLLLVVDDLAWSDASTFRFVVRLAERAADLRRREPVPLLVVATTRPELEGARRQGIDRLRREEICSTVELEGLDLLETAELLRELGLPTVTTQLAERVHRATSGSPLFIEAVARRLLAAGERAGASLDDTMPREIRDAIGDALERLSPDARALLRVASVLGPSCEVEELDELARGEVTWFEDALEEAHRLGVVEVAGDRLSFRHPLYRTYLYQSTRPARRRLLHAKIAERRSSHASPAAVAEHLIAAGSEEAPARVARTCAAAAQEAAAVFAWGEAARFYQEAIAVEDRAPGAFEEEEFAPLLRAAGVAADLSLDGDSASLLLARAAALFERLHDHAGLVQTALARVSCIVRHPPAEQAFRDAADALMAALGKLSGDERLRAHAMIALAELSYARGDFGGATELGRQALVASRACGSASGAVRAHLGLALTTMIQLELRESLEHLEEARRVALAASDRRLLALARLRQPLVRFWLGRLPEVESEAREALACCREAKEPLYEVLPLAAAACAAMARGDQATADEHVYEVLLIQRLSGYTWVSGMYLPAFASLQARRGEFEAARRTLAAVAEPAEGSWRLPSIARWYADLYVAARSGNLDEVRREIERHPRRVALEPWPFLGPASWAGALVEIADLLEDPELARPCVRVLEAALERGQIFSAGLLFHIPRVLGAAERLLGLREAAVARLRRAAEDTAAIGAWVEHALALRELASALADGGDEEREHALAVGRTARDALAGLGLEAELPLAESLLGRLSPAAAAAEPPTGEKPLAILFTDVEGSTPLVERLGDAQAFDVLQAHDRLVREQLSAWGGREVDQEGDSFFATFASAEHAARCAVGIQRSLARLPLGDTIRVRIGVHFGEVLREGERFFGLNVIVASRVADSAQAGEILASEAVRNALGASPNLRFGPAREVELKGLSRRYRVLPLVWTEDPIAV